MQRNLGLAYEQFGKQNQEDQKLVVYRAMGVGRTLKRITILCPCQVGKASLPEASDSFWGSCAYYKVLMM